MAVHLLDLYMEGRATVTPLQLLIMYTFCPLTTLNAVFIPFR